VKRFVTYLAEMDVAQCAPLQSDGAEYDLAMRIFFAEACCIGPFEPHSLFLIKISLTQGKS
jgi:hypothetical protein